MKSRLIATSFTDQIAIGFIVTDRQEMWALTKELKVKNVPGLAYYKNGQHIETTIGLRPQEQIEVTLKTRWQKHKRGSRFGRPCLTPNAPGAGQRLLRLLPFLQPGPVIVAVERTVSTGVVRAGCSPR